ncbi:hypothetical protein D1007_18793 [Hordeum vulgare]|nr:hypothetical protein D1007_18793 [Hordeum vulgare]
MVQILSLIHNKDGKLSSMPYLTANITNLKAKYRRESKLADVEDTIAYFKEKAKEDLDFFFRIRLDDEDHVRNMYRVDGAPRGASKHYRIRDVFPTAVHKHYRWHIIKKAEETLGPFFVDHLESHKAFKLCVNHDLTMEVFERSWTDMIEKYQVQDNETLQSLWEKRMYWVPAYFMKCFYPFLQTTQRSEGFNAVLKHYVSPDNSLL